MSASEFGGHGTEARPEGERTASGAAPDHWAAATAPAWLAPAQLTVAALALILLFLAIPHALTGDGHARYDALNTLLTRGHLNETRYSYIGPLFASPIWIADRRLVHIWWAERFNVLVLAAGAGVAWWLLRPLAPPLVRASFILLLVAAGMMPNHVRDFYGEVFTAVFVAIGLLAVLAANRREGWIAVALGVANTPATAVGLLLIAVWRAWRHRRFDALVVLGCAAALILLENDIVRGGFLEGGYARDHGARTVLPFSARPGFSYPLLLGVLSLLFSFGKGLFFFAPGLTCVLAARRLVGRALADVLDAWMLFLVGVLLVYSQWWAWYGGWYWGPRFLLFAVFPSALALAVVLNAQASASRRMIAVAVAAWTAWVGISGAVFGQDALGDCMTNDYAFEHLCWYVPEFSPLFRPLVLPTQISLVGHRLWIMMSAVAAILLSLPFFFALPDRPRISRP